MAFSVAVTGWPESLLLAREGRIDRGCRGREEEKGRGGGGEKGETERTRVMEGGQKEGKGKGRNPERERERGKERRVSGLHLESKQTTDLAEIALLL